MASFIFWNPFVALMLKTTNLDLIKYVIHTKKKQLANTDWKVILRFQQKYSIGDT